MERVLRNVRIGDRVCTSSSAIRCEVRQASTREYLILGELWIALKYACMARNVQALGCCSLAAFAKILSGSHIERPKMSMCRPPRFLSQPPHFSNSTPQSCSSHVLIARRSTSTSSVVCPSQHSAMQEIEANFWHRGRGYRTKGLQPSSAPSDRDQEPLRMRTPQMGHCGQRADRKQVIKALQSLNSRGYVKTQFSWQWYV